MVLVIILIVCLSIYGLILVYARQEMELESLRQIIDYYEKLIDEQRVKIDKKA